MTDPGYIVSNDSLFFLKVKRMLKWVLTLTVIRRHDLLMVKEQAILLIVSCLILENPSMGVWLLSDKRENISTRLKFQSITIL